MRRRLGLWGLALLWAGLTVGCGVETAPPTEVAPPTAAVAVQVSRPALLPAAPRATPTATALPATRRPFPTPFPFPLAATPLPAPRTPAPGRVFATAQVDVPLWTATPTPSPQPTPLPTATWWPTVTRQVLPPAVAAGLVPCAQRSIDPGLFTFVSQQFGLPPGWAPGDLRPLGDYLPEALLRGPALQLRVVAAVPLQRMVEEMQQVGLRPAILSAYRSYDEQALAWQWWSRQYPDRVAIMSARPGHSEHQLGTAVDFGSPELNYLFHVDFAQTAEGLWLAAHAPRFGFTMSYPAHARALTGFKYEPWHFRYVGVEMAERLREGGQFLSEWQLANLPPPCVP